MTEARIERIARFLEVAEGLKTVERAGYIADGSRHETDSDHTWHMALFALVLAHESESELDMARLLAMILVHDMVEIFAGDVVIYDVAAREAARERELEAAERLFGMLPEDSGAYLRRLWDEFEAAESKEARYAKALDRLQAFAQNVIAGGKSWRERGVTRELTDAINGPLADADPVVGALYRLLVQRAEDRDLWPRSSSVE